MIGTYKGRNILNVRRGAGTGYPVVKTLAPGESVAVEEVSNGWAKCEAGYIMADKLEFSDDEQPAEVADEPETDGSTVLEKMTVAELRVLASQSGIALGAGMKKADIIAEIRNA